MKKIILLLLLATIMSNAEMVQRGDGGVFISNEDQSEIANLLNSDDSNADEYDERNNPDMEKIEDEEKFQLIKPVKERKKTEYGKDNTKDDFSLPDKKSKLDHNSDLNKREKGKIKLKDYSNIQYDNSMYSYSIRKPTPNKFNSFLKRNNINKTIFKNLVGYGSTIQQAKISALYYDYYKENPAIAENFYKILFKKKSQLSLTDKISLADYLLRTGRGDKASKILNKGKCLGSFGKNKYNCLYFLGVEKYLKTGKNKNSELRISKKRVRQAKELYYMKKR